ncbi:macrophage mannose receptor 1-like [Macrobrachium nipponense]|uniref:macrophage mannose receptor 1-like n=1 Tax=Macrobrachium nipponense TaxID=159736 RepID=UPI0030C81CE8
MTGTAIERISSAAKGKHPTLPLALPKPQNRRCRLTLVAATAKVGSRTPKLESVTFSSLEEQDHYSAQQHCQYMEGSSSGVELISLSTFEEHAFVWDYIKSQHFSQQRFSIGMRNEYVDGNYWTDNSPVGFFHWSDNEPSGDGFCTEMYVDSGKFNDIDCSEVQAFICEKKGRNYSPLTPPSPPEPTCPSGWTSFNRHCYLFSGNDDTWENAKASCESNLNSVLASIENADEDEFLKGNAAALGKDLWLGLHDDDAGNNWHWIDGSEYGQYTNWGSGQPDDYQENEHCGELRHSQGDWNDLPCSNTLGFVCKITLEVCPHRWNFWNEKCYYRSDDVISNDQARQKCKEFNANADLVTIESLRENNYFADLFSQGSQGVWNGYTYDPTSKAWSWDDGSSNPFTNWNAGEPNNLDWELCTEMIDAPYFDTHGKWNNLACTENRNFGCQYHPKHHVGCEVGWRLFGEVCYFVGRGQGNYYDSETHCKDLGGQIASVHSAEENDFFVSILPSEATGAWIGINDINQPESFVCADGSNFLYSSWGLMLSDQFDLPRCAEIQFDGKWVLRDCSSAGESDIAVVCSKPPEVKDITPDDSGCKTGDLYYRGSCYTISNTQLSWDEAKNACDREYSSLLRIEDEQEGAFFSSSFGDYGLDAWTDVKVRKYSDESFDFIFDDGKLATYLPWDSSEPNLGEGDCILIEGTPGVVGLYKAHACEKELNFICEYDRQGYTTLPPEPTPTHGTDCLGTWEHHGGHCYQVFTETHTWTEAEQVCQAYGGHLASINSQDEESFIQQKLWYAYELTFDDLWVGLQLDTEADKHWTDGSSIDYLHWEFGQPDMHEHENCASVNRYDTALSCTVCETHLPFICEGREGSYLTTLPPPTFAPPPKCTDGKGDWYLFKDHCYKFVSQADEDPQSWHKSVGLCRADGSHLSSIVDLDENFFIESMLNQLSDDSIWVGGRALEDSGFQWVDGSPFDYDNWAPGEPNSYMDQEDCIEMYNRGKGTWNDKNCGHLSGRVCKRPNGATVPPPLSTLPTAGNCPQNWIHVVTTGRCFKFVEEVTYFDQAVTSCRDLYTGAELVSLHTPKELAYITVMVGMYNAEAWIGLQYEMEDYVWVDQSTVDYTPWAPGEPNGQYMAENCVEVLYPTGLMNDISCYNMYGYICAMKQDPSITEPTTFPKCDPPYDNYYHYKDDCYRSERTPMSWDDAEKTCADEGAHLASAYDLNEGAFLWILGQDSSIVHPWIGLNDRRVQSTYEWTDNWPVSYTNWGKDQPQVNVTDKNCVMLDSDDGRWYNEKCEELKPFLCKHSEDKAPSPGPPVTGHCPDETWTNLPGSYCYLAVSDAQRWNDANAYCLFLDSNLTSIHSAEENSVLKHGLKIVKSNIWIGLIQKKSGFGWSDGTALDFQNWADGEPSYDYEQCTELYQEDGKWNDLPCDSWRPFICRTAKVRTLKKKNFN